MTHRKKVWVGHKVGQPANHSHGIYKIKTSGSESAEDQTIHPLAESKRADWSALSTLQRQWRDGEVGHQWK